MRQSTHKRACLPVRGIREVRLAWVTRDTEADLQRTAKHCSLPYARDNAREGPECHPARPGQRTSPAAPALAPPTPPPRRAAGSGGPIGKKSPKKAPQCPIFTLFSPPDGIVRPKYCPQPVFEAGNGFPGPILALDAALGINPGYHPKARRLITESLNRQWHRHNPRCANGLTNGLCI